MGKKSRKMSKGKRKPRDYEGFSFGPVQYERFGRMMRVSSNWKPQDHRKFIENLRIKRPEMKASIDEKAQQLLKILEENDPFEILSAIAYDNIFADPESYTELSHKGKECYVEYAIGLVLGHENLGFGKHATKEGIDTFKGLIESVFQEIAWFFVAEGAEEKSNLEQLKIRFQTIMKYLFVRGDSFIEHHLELVRELFKPHDQFLSEKLGYSIDQILDAIQESKSQIQQRFDGFKDGANMMKELHELFISWIDGGGAEGLSNKEDVMETFRSLPEVQEKKAEADAFRQAMEGIPFEITPNDRLPQGILDYFSSEIGDNKNFIGFHKAPAWPTNDSVVHKKPIIRHEDKYYLFLPQLLFRNIIDIVEDMIQRADKGYFQNAYQKARADLLENRALGYFGAMMPGASIYKNLYYRTQEGGGQIRAETDGIIIYDNNLFIIEAKAGSLSLSARRGGLERMKRDLASTIDSAYNQSLRTKRYIEREQTPRFENENGAHALDIIDKDRIQNVFLVSVTLENMDFLASRLPSLKNLDLIKGKEYPWSVFINDLRVISEIIESPSIFLTFLKRRIRANDFPGFEAHDELDTLMFYLNDGLYFENVTRKDKFNLNLVGYTEPLDRYYDYIAGRVSSGTKPSLKTSIEFKEIVKNIEGLGKEGFSNVTTSLLDLSGDSHRDIIEMLREMRERYEADGHNHDCTIGSKEGGYGLSFVIRSEYDQAVLQSLREYCDLKMYQTRLPKWFIIMMDPAGSLTSVRDFFWIEKPWVYDKAMQHKVDAFKKPRMETHRKGRKIGRNEQCPCGSGLKYKKCCSS